MQFLYRFLPKLPPLRSQMPEAVGYNMYENKALVIQVGSLGHLAPKLYLERQVRDRIRLSEANF
jgi:hypothetical protein